MASIQDANMQIRHQLREGDAERWVQYSQWLVGKSQAFMSQVILVIIGDEAMFQVNGNVSNHNVVCYAPHGGPPEDLIYDKPSSGEKLVVWIGLVRNNLTGPLFFDWNVNGEAYWRCFKTSSCHFHAKKLYDCKMVLAIAFSCL